MMRQDVWLGDGTLPGSRVLDWSGVWGRGGAGNWGGDGVQESKYGVGPVEIADLAHRLHGTFCYYEVARDHWEPFQKMVEHYADSNRAELEQEIIAGFSMTTLEPHYLIKVTVRKTAPLDMNHTHKHKKGGATGG